VIAQLKEAVLSGRLSLSKARRIVGVIDHSNATFWIDAALLPTKITRLSFTPKVAKPFSVAPWLFGI